MPSPELQPSVPPRAAYVHVPFCARRCGYCDFAIITGRDDLLEGYLQAVERELRWHGPTTEVETLYFGGGTPSYLPAALLRRLLASTARQFPLAAGGEQTVEANPEHVTSELLNELRSGGVTRLSLGVQSFDDAKLRQLERAHDGRQAADAVRLAQQAGFAVAVDLMFASPGESLDAWRSDLEQALALRPEHLSAYGLTYEPGAPFTRRRERGALIAIDEDLERDMYLATIDVLTAAGYQHYEVSNFALPSQRSRHNETYWAGGDYFAVGPGAARHYAGLRQTNCRSTVAYVKRVLAGESPVDVEETLTSEQRARERLVFGLRRLRGVSRRDFAAEIDLDQLAGAEIARFVRQGLLADDGDTIRLTRSGLLVSDSLWPDLL